MDIDVKISTKHYKIESNIVLKSIYHNQLGFISSVRRWFIIQITINIIHYTTGESEERERKEVKGEGKKEGRKLNHNQVGGLEIPVFKAYFKTIVIRMV